MNKGTLVYSDSIAAGEIADEILDVYQEDYDTDDENDDLMEESESIVQADEECSLQDLYQLLHLSSWVVTDLIIASDMNDMVEKGEHSALNYIRNNSLCENPDIYACITRTNLKTFSSLSKKVRSKNSKG